MAFTKLFSMLQTQVNDTNFVIIKTACMVSASDELSKQIKNTEDATTLFQFFAENKAHCNWMNIEFLEVIANASDNTKLRKLVENYKKVIFSKTLREVWDSFPCQRIRTKYYSDLQIIFKDQDPDNVTVGQLIQFCEHYIIKDIANSLLIGSVGEGSLKVVLLIPSDKVYQTYLSVLMLPQELRLDSYLQVDDWVVHHPLQVLQNLHKEYR